MNYRKIIMMTLLMTTALSLGACSTVQPSATGAPTPQHETTKPPITTPVPSTPAASNEAVTEIQEILNLAKEGKIANCEFPLEKGMFDDLEQAWGKPDTNEFAGKAMYATYKTKNIVVGYNKGVQIIDLRSDSSDIRKLTLEDILQALGETKDIRSNEGETIYVYPAGKDYELKFIVPKPTKQAPNPHVDHISVFYPRGAVNLMAG
ncbi:DUF4309 domain-containing protein [Paenibacillus albiflavus]|uniref:DUF4309 domain-containing protein n=1 Tax=Paenibacillus albiflavus TaxID=2545760 RepID=A0A4R4E0I7_9BACL|nr:YjgB family protein [Paenibacillus albiflavus]TCZ71070.1 DUF4309 domain-containing protein [Paenibacillus albiflavus]